MTKALIHNAKDENSRFAVPLAQNDLHLRILATSDLHAHILPYDYYADTDSDTKGLARTSGLIARARAEVANCILVDNGDFLQGSPLGDYVAEIRGLAENPIHPMIAAMNLLGYDAATLGNHEFNYGLDFLLATIEKANFPIVSANIAYGLGVNPVKDNHLIAPWVIIDRKVNDVAGKPHSLRIGIIGFAPPQTVIWDHRHLSGRIEMRDIIEAAKAHVPTLCAGGADIVLALSHSGIGGASAVKGMENASVPLARVAGIDALITGHVHLVFPGPGFAVTPEVDPVRGTVCGRPAVMPGFYGSHLGVIDLALRQRNGRWQVIDHMVEAVPIADRTADGLITALVPNDDIMSAAVGTDHEGTLSWSRRTIGQTPVPLHSYFALITDTPAFRLVAQAQRRFVKTRLQGTPFEHLPVLSAVAPFKAGGRGGPDNYIDVPAGDLAMRHAADLYIHPNTITAVQVTGKELRIWLERAAGLFNHVTPGSVDAPLINPHFPSFMFDMIDGLTYQINLAAHPRFDGRGLLADPMASRISNLCWHGVPIDQEANFVLATNSYRSSGSGGFVGPTSDKSAGKTILSTTDSIRDVLVRHIADWPAADTQKPPQWRFMAMAGTTVTFDTSPNAPPHMADLKGLHVEPVAMMQTGFMRFRLHL